MRQSFITAYRKRRRITSENRDLSNGIRVALALEVTAHSVSGLTSFAKPHIMKENAGRPAQKNTEKPADARLKKTSSGDKL
jgi:hypothetical protein